MSSGTNDLAHSSSAYLRSAMHQPVRWREWSEEAFAAAQRENKPILLDIGAVWCHWCHVMDRESYESPEVAEIINANFIAVKVDRDERPEVDARYQTAVAAISGQGGWPLTAFLTSDGKPFYGGTYFPPQDMMGHPGLRRLLLAIAEAFRERRQEVEEEAGKLMHALAHAEGLLGRTGTFSPRILEQMVQSGIAGFDRENGGFGGAPKFPHPAALDVLMDWHARTGEEPVAAVISRTLEKMALGGVYDQLAGGFHRYSVDEYWRVPHFEKMSYDNAELLKNYIHGYQLTGNVFFARVARDIMRWMDEVLSDRDHGGFYASQDADIDLHDDGDHFTWTADEARAVLDDAEFEAACLHYDIEDVGEMHHNHAKNVLWVRRTVDEIAAQSGRGADETARLLRSAKRKMLAARLQRPVPYIDRTVYVNWNALAISAYLQAARVLAGVEELGKDTGVAEARHFALRSLDRILSEAWKPGSPANALSSAGVENADGRLLHVVAYSERTENKPAIAGLLDDYAFTALACLDAYETTADMTYFRFARSVAEAMIVRFHDGEGGGFFDAAIEGRMAIGALAARRKPFQDSPTPAGDSAAALVLLRLWALTGEQRYRDLAQKTLELFAGVAEQFGIYAGTYGIAGTWLSRPYLQVVIVGGGPAAESLYAAALRPFALNKTVLHVTDEEATASYLPPVLADSVPHLPGIGKGKAMAVVCSNFTCQPPVEDPAELSKLISTSIRQKT